MRLGSWLNSLQSNVSRQIRPTDRRIRRRRSNLVSREINELETRTLLAAVSWDGGGGDFQWSNAANWSGDVLPGVDDDVTIDFGTNDFTVVHAAGADSVHSINSNASLNVAGGELFVSASSTIHSDLSLVATFGGSGNITVSGHFDWTNGKLQGANGGGSLTASGGTFVGNGPGHVLAAGFRFINPVGSTVDWVGGQNIRLREHSFFDNYGTVNQQTDLAMDSEDSLSEFNNYGTFMKSGGTGNQPHGSWISVGTVNNSGLMDVQVGTLTLGYFVGSTTTNTGTIQGAADTRIRMYSTHSSSGIIDGDVVEFSGGTATVSGSFRANTTVNYSTTTITGSIEKFGDLEVWAPLNLTDATFAPGATTLDSLKMPDFVTSLTTDEDLTVSGHFDWTNGKLQGANGGGSLTVLSDSTIASNLKAFDFTLINSAVMTWTGGTIQFYGSTGGFVNAVGATFDDQIDGTFGSVDGNCLRFTNDGYFLKSGGTGSTYLQMQLYNRGTVEIQQGQLYLGCGYVSTSPDPPDSGIILPPGEPPIYEPPGDLPLPPDVPVIVPGSFTQTVTGVLIEQIAGHSGGTYGTPGTDYGQLVVNGDVALNGSLAVQLINGFVPTTDQQFLVIDNRGSNAITGTFIGLPEETVFTVGVRLFQISYVGGNGNDVTLTDVGPSISDVTVSVVGGTFTYDGLAHGATSSSVTAADGFTAIPTLVYYVGTNISGTGSSLAPLDAGVYTVVASFAGDSSHNPGSASATITINKATANITVSGYTGVYDGDAHGATGSVTGVDVGGAAPGGSLNLGATFISVPGGTAHWIFSGGTNYNDASGDVAIVINKANAVVTVSGYSGTYDAAAHGSAGSVVGVIGDLSAAGSSLSLGASFTNAPGGTANWTFTGGTNYNDQNGTAAIVINKATQTIVWSTPSAINYGTPLSGTQLNATVFGVTGGSALGTLTYTPPSGTVLLAGTQTLTVTADATTNYLAATTSVSLLVVKSYTSNGFLEPIRTNRAFKQGSTIPIKWQLYDASGNIVTSLSAITDLTVTGPSGTTQLYPGNNNSSGNTVLRNEGNQYIYNWKTKDFALGNYTIQATLADGTSITEQIMLSTNGSAAALVIDGVQGTSAGGALLAGDMSLYIDNSNGTFSADQLARIQDAVAGIQLLISPYGANIFVVDASIGQDANIVLDRGIASVLGGMAEGILGVTTTTGQITIIDGWNWYAGAKAAEVGSGQFDFQTVITHEIAHSLGLGHSSASSSVMFPELRTGDVRRTLIGVDLNLVEEAHEGAGLHVEALYATGGISGEHLLKDTPLFATPATHRTSNLVTSGTSTVSNRFLKSKDQDLQLFVRTPVTETNATPIKSMRSVPGRSGALKLRATMFNDLNSAEVNGRDDSSRMISGDVLLGHDEDLFGPGADWWLNLN